MGRRCLLRDTVLAEAHLNDNAEAGYQRWSSNLRALKSAPHVPQNSGYAQCELLGPRRPAATEAMNEAEDHLPAV